MTNNEKMDAMNIQERAIFIHDFYKTHHHITVNDFEEWLSKEINPKLSNAERAILENIDAEEFVAVGKLHTGILVFFDKNGISYWAEIFNNKVFGFIKENESYNIKELLKCE